MYTAHLSLTSISSRTAPSAVSMAAEERSSACITEASASDTLVSRSCTCTSSQGLISRACQLRSSLTQGGSLKSLSAWEEAYRCCHVVSSSKLRAAVRRALVRYDLLLVARQPRGYSADLL